MQSFAPQILSDTKHFIFLLLLIHLSPSLRRPSTRSAVIRGIQESIDVTPPSFTRQIGIIRRRNQAHGLGGARV